MLLDLLSREDNTVAPPEHVVRRVIATFRAQISSSSLRRIVASLLFDNFRQAPLAAVRGVARSRQLLFSTEGLDIDVQITSESGSATLIGQALDRDRASVEPRPFVRLYHSGGEVLDASEADAHGQFAFHAVPPGVYNLGVELGATEIVLEDLELAND
ncbi:MAG TPA: hypothetical protein VJG32_06045 [Anaerolineae bacterium]|nr:hypothetical protein [Anaerolineae bacterium]